MYVQDEQRFLGYTYKQMSNIFIMLLFCLSALPLVRLRTYKETSDIGLWDEKGMRMNCI